jgi:hypothetical protein
VAALVTSFGEDVEWVLSVVPPTIPITLVRHWDAPDKVPRARTRTRASSRSRTRT